MNPGNNGNRRTILVVDDNAMLPDLFRAYLPRLGYRVETAFDGMEALDVMRKIRINLVLLDLDMPRLDGLGVLHAMSLDPSLRTIPVIAMSGRPNKDLRKRSSDAGALDFIEKPFDLSAVRDSIERHIGSQGGQAGAGPVAVAPDATGAS